MKLGCTLISVSQGSSRELSISHRFAGKLGLVCGLKVGTRGAKTGPPLSILQAMNITAIPEMSQVGIAIFLQLQRFCTCSPW